MTRTDVLMSAGLLLCLIIVYSPAIRGGRILDDDLHITRPELQSIAGLARIWFDVGATQQYYPVLHSAFWVEHRIWGEKLICYHAVNIALHWLASLSIVSIMRRLSLTAGWLGAFIFALHPVCVESVAWIAEQKNALSTVFAAAAVIAYLDFDAVGKTSRYWVATIFFCLAVLSKTAVSCLPAILLVVIWWRRPRLNIKRDVLPLLPWVILASGAAGITIFVESNLISRAGGQLALTPLSKLILAGRVFWFYVAKDIFPAHLAFYYTKWQINSSVWWQYLFPVCVVFSAVGVWSSSSVRRAPLVLFLCYTATIAPVAGFINVEWFNFSYVADHLEELSVFVFSIAAASSLGSFYERYDTTIRDWRIPAALALLLALGGETWLQCHRYKDAVTIYQAALIANPESQAAKNHLAVAHYNLGLINQGLPNGAALAAKEYEAALQIKPNYAEAHNNLGMVLEGFPGHAAAAAEQFREAVVSKPDFAGAHYNLARSIVSLGLPVGAAVREYREAIRIDPSYVDAHWALARTLAKWPGHDQEALDAFQIAVRLDPNVAEGRLELGRALIKAMGDFNGAEEQFSRAIRLDPKSSQAHFDLGVAFQNMPGHLGDAKAQFEQALKLHPDFAEAHYNLGCILLNTPGRALEAVAEFSETLRIQPSNAEALTNLANAENSLGNSSEAIAAYKKGIMLEPNNPVIHYNLAIVLLSIPSRIDEAIAELRIVLRLHPNDEQAGRILARLGTN